LVRKHEGRTPLERSILKWEDNIRIDLREMMVALVLSGSV